MELDYQVFLDSLHVHSWYLMVHIEWHKHYIGYFDLFFLISIPCFDHALQIDYNCEGWFDCDES